MWFVDRTTKEIFLDHVVLRVVAVNIRVPEYRAAIIDGQEKLMNEMELLEERPTEIESLGVKKLVQKLYSRLFKYPH